MEAMTSQLPAVETYSPEYEPMAEQIEPAMGLRARIGNAIRSGYDALSDRIDTLAYKGKALAAIGGIAFVGAQSAELSVSTTPVTAEGNTPTATASSLEQECTNIALTEPKIVKALVVNAGQYQPEPNQHFSLSTRYQHWPEECQGSYARGNRAKAQAFHNGHWQDVTYWSSVRINAHPDPFLDGGNWFDLGNEKNVDFPICKARILLKAGIVDLSVDMNPNVPWKQHHPMIAGRQFAPIPAKLQPHTPAACK